MRGETKELNDATRTSAGVSFIPLTDGITHYELGGNESGEAVVLVHGFSAYQCRSETHHILSMGWKGFTENKTLFLAVVVGILLQIVIIYYPPLQAAFEVTSLTLEQFIFCVICGSSAFVIMPSWLIKKRKFVDN